NINRPRSLAIEAYRYLADPADAELRDIVLARLEVGRTAMRRHGGAVRIPPYGEQGMLFTREQAYTALVMCEKHPESKPEVYKLLREANEATMEGFESFAQPIMAVRRYAAVYIGY